MSNNLFNIKCECDTCGLDMISTKMFKNLDDAYACRFQWVLHTKFFPCDDNSCAGHAIPIIYEFDKGWKKLI